MIAAVLADFGSWIYRPLSRRSNNILQSGRSITLFVVQSAIDFPGVPGKLVQCSSSSSDLVALLLAFPAKLRVCTATTFDRSLDLLRLVLFPMDSQDGRSNYRAPCLVHVLLFAHSD